MGADQKATLEGVRLEQLVVVRQEGHIQLVKTPANKHYQIATILTSPEEMEGLLDGFRQRIRLFGNDDYNVLRVLQLLPPADKLCSTTE
jgi:hypothetical protein